MNQIIPVPLEYKKPSSKEPPLNSKGSKSIWITWSKAVRSNSFIEHIWAKALLPIYWMLFGRTILDFSQWQCAKAYLPMYSTPSSKLMLIISLVVNDQSGELLKKAPSSIFLIVLGIVKLQFMKCQLISVWIPKASQPISVIVYSTPSQTNLPPLKLKSPDAKKLHEQSVILHSLGLVYSIVIVPLSAPINLASIFLVIISFSLILFLHYFLSLTTSLFFKPTVVILPKKHVNDVIDIILKILLFFHNNTYLFFVYILS